MKGQTEWEKSGWADGFVEADGVRIHYYRTGGDKPPLVLAHGITDNGMCWSRLARALQPDYDVIMYDARGHGLSDAPVEGYGIAEHVADLVGFVRALGLDRPILMGHSMGGATVARAAAQYPHLARAVILEDPVHMFDPPQPPPEEWETAARQIRADIAARKDMTREDLARLCSAEIHPGWETEDYEHWAESKHQVSPNIVATFAGLPSLQESFPRISCPVLILKADADEESRRRNQEVADLLPDGQLVHVAGAGHNVRRDRFEATLDEIKSFLGPLA